MMPDNSKVNINSHGNFSRVNVSDISNEGVISTLNNEIANAVEQLPESQQAGLPGIKELLTQLHNRISGNGDLPLEMKAEALQQVKVLAAAGKNPQSDLNRSQAQTANEALRGMSGKLPDATNFIAACNLLLPNISEIFGIE